MNEKINKLLKEYPRLVRERNNTAHQIAHFRGVTAEEVIESMYTVRSDRERVRVSGMLDKAEQIALNYQGKTDKINREWLEALENRLDELNEEITYFESALNALSGVLPDFMRDLVMHNVTWDALESKYHISRFTVGAYRKKAIAELEGFYTIPEGRVVGSACQWRAENRRDDLTTTKLAPN